MKFLLCTILVTYVTATNFPQFSGAELIAEDEKMAEASALKTLRDHEGDHEMKNIFDLLAPALKKFFEGLNNASDEDMGLDSSTESGFNKEVDAVLGAVKADACQREEKCESPFMGCNCHGHFRSLKDGMCQELPCVAVSYLYRNTAKFMSNMREQKTLNDLVGLGMKFAEPLTKHACHCNPSLFNATASCIKDYNGDLIEGRKEKKEFKKAVKKIKFDHMVKFASTMFRAYCGTEDGVCLASFRNLFTEMAAMLDRSCAGEQEDKCNNYRRLSDGIWKFIMFMSDEERDEKPSLSQIVGNFYRNIPRNFWCGDAECAAGFLSKYFNNNCCFRNAVNTLDADLIQVAEKFMRSMGILPKLGKSVRKNISKAVNPGRACARSYAKTAEKCDALQAFLL